VSYLPGDATGDGIINMIDITKVIRIYHGKDTATLGADANLDGVVNMLDVTKVRNYYFGYERYPAVRIIQLPYVSY